MASRYAITGGGSVNWSSTGSWSATSGGATGASVPTSSDDVFLDGASGAGTLTVDAASNCLGFDATGFTGTFAGTFTLTVAGNLKYGTAGTYSQNGGITMSGTGTQTITTSGSTINGVLTLDGSGGTFNQQDNITAGAGSSIVVKNGTFNTNDHSYTGGFFEFAPSGAGTRAVNLGASTITLSGSNGFNAAPSTNLTWNAGTSSITLTSGSFFFQGDGLTYNNVTFASTSGGSTKTLSGANTFANFTFTGSANVGDGFTIGSSITVTGTFTATGAAPSQRPLIKTSLSGTAKTITAGTVSITDVDFQDITGAGAAAPFTGTRLGNLINNSGITFPAPASKFYVGNTANYDGAVWATTSGGSGATTNYPLPQDTAVFDANSFSANSQTITVNDAFRIPGVDFSAVTKTGITWAFGAFSPTIYGDVVLLSGLSVTASTGILKFSPRTATQTLTSAGVSVTALQAAGPTFSGGVFKLADALTSTGEFSLFVGATLDLNGKVLTCLDYNGLSGNGARTIKSSANGGKIATTITTAAGVAFAGKINAVFDQSAGSWTIEIGGNTANSRTFTGAGLTYPKVTFTNTTANGTLAFSGSNTFDALVVSNPPQKLTFVAATTTTIKNGPGGFPSGTSGNLVTIDSATASTHTLSKSGGGIIQSDYLSVAHSTGSPGTTWYAGTHSTDAGGNSGWIFTDPPPDPYYRETDWSLESAIEASEGDETWWHETTEQVDLAPTPLQPWDYDPEIEPGVVDADVGDEFGEWAGEYGGNDFGPKEPKPPQPQDDDPSARLGDDALEADDWWLHEIGSNDAQPKYPTPIQPWDYDPEVEPGIIDADVGDDQSWIDQIGANDQNPHAPKPPQPQDDDPSARLGDDALEADDWWHQEVGSYDRFAVPGSLAAKIVQGWVVPFQGFQNADSAGGTFASIPAAGDLLVVFASVSSTSILASISDTIGDGVPWNAIASSPTNNAGYGQAAWGWWKVVGGAPTGKGITVTATGANVWLGMAEYMASGADGASGSFGTGTAQDPGSIATTGPGVVLGFIQFSAASPFAGAGFTRQVNDFANVEDRSTVSAGTFDPSWSSGLSNQWVALGAAFKAASGLDTPLQPYEYEGADVGDDQGQADDWWHDLGANDLAAEYPTPQQPQEYSGVWSGDDQLETDEWWHGETPNEQVDEAPTPPAPYEFEGADLTSDEGEADDWWADVGTNDEQAQAPTPRQPEELSGADLALDEGEVDDSWHLEGANDLVNVIIPPPWDDDPTARLGDDGAEVDDWWADGAPSEQGQQAPVPPQPQESDGSEWTGGDALEADDWWNAEGANDAVPQAPVPPQPRDFDASAEAVGDDDVGDDSWFHEVGASELEEEAPTPPQPWEFSPAAELVGDDDVDAGDQAITFDAGSEFVVQAPTPQQPFEIDAGADLSGDDDVEVHDEWWFEFGQEEEEQAPTPPQPSEFAGTEFVGDDQGDADDWWHEVGSNDLQPQAATPPQPRESDGSEWLGDDAIEADDWLLDGAPFEQGPQAPTPPQPQEFAGDELTSDEAETDEWWHEEPGVNEEQPEAPTPPQPGEYEAADSGDDQGEVDEWWHLVGSEDLLVYGIPPSQPAVDASAEAAFLGDDDVSGGDEAMYFDQGNESDVPYPYRRLRGVASDSSAGGATTSDAAVGGASLNDAAIGGANLSEGI